MTIIVPEWMVNVFIALCLISITLSVVQIILTRRLADLTRYKTKASLALADSIRDMLAKVIDYDKKNNAEWIRYRNIEYVDIKSPIIATGVTDKGGVLLRLANGAAVGLKQKGSTQTQMDS